MPKSPSPPEQIAAPIARLPAAFRTPTKRCAACWRHLPREAFYICPSRYDCCSTFCRECDNRKRVARRRRRTELQRTLKANGAGAAHAVVV